MKKSIVIISYLIAVLCILFVFADMALCWQYASEFKKPFSMCAGDITKQENVVAFNQGALPYGVLWAAINPMYYTQIPYRIYLALFVSVMFFVYMKLYKPEDYDILVYWSITNIVYALMHWHQNITIVAMFPLAIYLYKKLDYKLFKRFILGSFVMLIVVLQKLPIGWGNDAHWYCAKYCSYPINFNVNNVLILPITSPAHCLSYGILVIWFIIPLLLFMKNRKV